MKSYWQIVLEQSLTLGSLGLVIGGIGGWISIFFGEDLNIIAGVSAKAYWVMIFLIPACLAYLTNDNLTKNLQTVYDNIIKALTFVLITGIGGVLISSALFLIPATNLPFILKQLNPVEVREALYVQIGLPSFIIYLVLTAIVAIFSAFYAHNKTKQS